MTYFFVNRKHRFDLYLLIDCGQWSSGDYLALWLVIMFERIPYMEVQISKRIFPIIIHSTNVGWFPNVSESGELALFPVLIATHTIQSCKAWIFFSLKKKIRSVGIWRAINSRCKYYNKKCTFENVRLPKGKGRRKDQGCRQMCMCKIDWFSVLKSSWNRVCHKEYDH